MLLLFCVVVNIVSIEGIWEKAIEDEANGVVNKVHIVYRHGHKEPKDLYPTDPNKNIKVWYNGPGQLTSLGKQQGLRLGKNIKSRYSDVIPEVGVWKTVHASSSNSDRTLMTSAMVLSGLLPADSKDYWLDDTRQPPAIHVADVLANNIRCPRYNQEVKGLSKECTNKYLCKTVSKYSGKEIRTLAAIQNFYTTLQIEKQAKLKIPLWATKLYSKIEKEALNDVQKILKYSTLTSLRIGPIIENLLASDDDTDPKIHIYCTHDHVLGPLVGVFNVTVNKPPDFVSALLIEHRQIQGETHVQIWYSTGDDSEPSQVTLPGCGKTCLLADVRRVLSDLVPKDWDQACSLDWNVDWGPASRYVFAALALLVIVFLCVRSYGGYGGRSGYVMFN